MCFIIRPRSSYCHGHRRVTTQEAVWCNGGMSPRQTRVLLHQDTWTTMFTEALSIMVLNLRLTKLPHNYRIDQEMVYLWANRGWFIQWNSVSVSWGFHTNDHKLGGLKSQKCILSQFRGQKSKIKLARLVPSRGSEGELVLCLSHSCCWLPVSLRPLPLFSHRVLLSVSLRVFRWPSYKDASHWI